MAVKGIDPEAATLTRPNSLQNLTSDFPSTWRSAETLSLASTINLVTEQLVTKITTMGQFLFLSLPNRASPLFSVHAVCSVLPEACGRYLGEEQIPQ